MADPSQSVLLRGGRSPRCCGEVGSACASASPSRGAYSEPTCSLAPGKMEKQHWGNHSWRCYSISQQSPPKPHVVQMKIDFWFFKNNILDQISTLPQQKAGLWDKTQNYNKSPIGCLSHSTMRAPKEMSSEISSTQTNIYHNFNGNFRILKWRYCTI